MHCASLNFCFPDVYIYKDQKGWTGDVVLDEEPVRISGISPWIQVASRWQAIP